MPLGCSWVKMQEDEDEDGGQERAQWMIRVEVPLSWNPKLNHVTAIPPSGPRDKLQAAARADPTCSSKKKTDTDAKEAVTLFTCISQSEAEGWSIVECLPLTGRTHQIRVHLEYLGFSIANDTQYGGLSGPPLAFRLNRERTEPVSEAQSKRLKGIKASDSESQCNGKEEGEGKDSRPQCLDGPGAAGDVSLVTLEALDDTLPDQVRELYESSLYQVDASDQEEICPHCPCLVPRGYPIDLEPLYLYAYEYQGPGWGFRVPPPEWARL